MLYYNFKSRFSDLFRTDFVKEFLQTSLYPLLFCLISFSSFSVQAKTQSWQDLISDAKGQTVYFNAWGGDTRINAYIDWVGDQVKEKYDIDLVHVKLTDTAHAVARVLSEKTAGNATDGSIDLIWINGENFASMKHKGLLKSPWVANLPAFAAVDTVNKPTTLKDFSETTDGLEAPWGMAHFVFLHNSAYVKEAPKTATALLEWSERTPGRFSYPQPPNYIGVTFLKQLLLDLSAKTDLFRQPVGDVDANQATEVLWQYLDRLHKVSWRKGKLFPENQAILRRMLGDGEVDIALAFDPAAASAAIANGELPDTVRSFVFEKGMIGNTHFVTIPFNSPHFAAAQLVADFLMSPVAQLRKQDPEYWGNFTILDLQKLSASHQKAFEDLDLGIATLRPDQLGAVQVEFHASWTDYLKQTWQKRYLKK